MAEAQNLAVKYSPKVVERFYLTSLTEGGVNRDYDWDGVTTVNVYSVDTVTMNNYTRAGSDRYGAINDVGTTKQTLTLSRDRSFTTVLDTRNNDESQGALDAGKFLAREIREVVTPEIDVYRLAAWDTAAASTGKNAVVSAAATTTTNAYSDFLALQSSLSDDLVPMGGRVAYMTNAYYALLKRSDYVLASNDAYGDRKTGQYGTVDGVPIVITPSSYMPANVNLVLVHQSATVSPLVMTSYQTHNNPPGINGNLVEGRIVYDAFVLTTKIKAVAEHKTA